MANTVETPLSDLFTVYHPGRIDVAFRLEQWATPIPKSREYVAAFYLDDPSDPNLVIQRTFDVLGTTEEAVAFAVTLALEFARALVHLKGGPNEIKGFVDHTLSKRIHRHNRRIDLKLMRVRTAKYGTGCVV